MNIEQSITIRGKLDTSRLEGKRNGRIYIGGIMITPEEVASFPETLAAALDQFQKTNPENSEKTEAA